MDSKQRYMMRGVSAMKEDVHNAIKNIDKGIFPQAFCKIIPDILGGDPEYCNIMHADGAGTKSSLAYMYWKETGDLSTALGKLMAISESYTELKASENFSELQAQLEGTENRIAESRRLYNESVQTFNTAVRRFPANIVAGIFGFEKKSKFEAQESAANAPQVEF